MGSIIGFCLVGIFVCREMELWEEQWQREGRETKTTDRFGASILNGKD